METAEPLERLERLFAEAADCLSLDDFAKVLDPA